MGRWISRALVVLTVAGCGFDADGKGSSAGLPAQDADGMTSEGMDSGSSGDGTAATSGSDSGTSTTTGDPVASTTDAGVTTAEGSGSTGAGSALVEISDGPTFDFGPSDLGSTVTHSFTVSNHGDVEATGIGPAALPAPFAFAGANYPGSGGNCGDALGPDETCTLVVEFAPDSFGTAAGALSLDYASPDGVGNAAVSLSGVGVGATENLIANPGAEQGGSPPVGWTEVVGTVWTVWNGFSRTGQYCILGGPVNGQPGTYRLGQRFDLTQYADLIDDQGGLHVTYNGYARTWGTDDDIYRIGLRTYDDDGAVVGTMVTAPGTGSGWAFLELELDTAPNVREVEIQVICIFNAGSACDAFFDDMSMTLRYDGL